MNTYLLGIDNGSSEVKAAVFDLRGSTVGIGTQSVSTRHPFPGRTEYDYSEVWQVTSAAIRGALSEAGIDGTKISAIGVTGHGNGLYLLDRQGRPLKNGIASTDLRAVDIIDRWDRSALFERSFPLTRQSYWAGQSNALLAWIKKHDPECYSRIGTAFCVKDLIKYRLTGTVSTDYTDACGSGLMNVHLLEYNSDLLGLYGIADILPALPQVLKNDDIVGAITKDAAMQTGLREGTPVACGLFDIDASALGNGVIEPGQMCMIAGTWSINEVITREPLIAREILMTRPYAVPGRWISIEGSASSATNLDWFVREFCGNEQMEADVQGVSVFELCCRKATRIPNDEATIVFHPYLFGSNIDPNARAGFYGIGGWHSRAHLLRGLLEGVTFSHAIHVDKLKQAGAKIDGIRLTGGGARSPEWSQMFADTLRLPVEVVSGEVNGARGAAICAGIGTGMFATYAAAVDSTIVVERRHEPDMQSADYLSCRYEQFLHIAEAMKPAWAQMSKNAGTPLRT